MLRGRMTARRVSSMNLSINVAGRQRILDKRNLKEELIASDAIKNKQPGFIHPLMSWYDP